MAAEAVAVLLTKRVLHDSAVLLEHILMLSDIWTCRLARSVSRGWCSVVTSLCDGQVKTLVMMRG